MTTHAQTVAHTTLEFDETSRPLIRAAAGYNATIGFRGDVRYFANQRLLSSYVHRSTLPIGTDK